MLKSEMACNNDGFYLQETKVWIGLNYFRVLIVVSEFDGIIVIMQRF